MENFTIHKSNNITPAISRISTFSEPEFQRIVDLANNSFGDGYMTLPKLKSIFGTQTSLFVASDSVSLYGYALNYIADFDISANHLRLPHELSMGIRPESGKICSVKSEAVIPQYRGGSLLKKSGFGKKPRRVSVIYDGNKVKSVIFGGVYVENDTILAICG